MKQFIDTLIQYLDTEFNNETTIRKKPKGHYAYEYNLKPTSATSYFTIQALSVKDGIEDFNGVETSQFDIQINIYAVKMYINEILHSAQSCSMQLADLCEKYMKKYKYNSNNGVISMKMITRSPTMPYDDGGLAYITAIRYRIEIKN